MNAEIDSLICASAPQESRAGKFRNWAGIALLGMLSYQAPASASTSISCFMTWVPGNFVLTESYSGPCPDSGVDFYGEGIESLGPEGTARTISIENNLATAKTLYQNLSNRTQLTFSGFDVYLGGDPFNENGFPKDPSNPQYLYQNHGTWRIADNSDLLVAPDVSARFVNYGTFQKSGGTGRSAVDIDFTNQGQILVNTGTLAFVNKFDGRSGSITVANRATVSFAGAQQVALGTVTGAGTLDAGTVGTQLYSGTLQNIRLSGNWLVIDPPDFPIHPPVNAKGTLTNLGTLTLNGNLQLVGDTTLAGSGTTILGSKPGSIIFSQAPTSFILTIGSGHTLRGGGIIKGGYNDSGHIVNQGILLADSTSRALEIYGSIDNQKGRIEIANGSSGLFVRGNNIDNRAGLIHIGGQCKDSQGSQQDCMFVSDGSIDNRGGVIEITDGSSNGQGMWLTQGSIDNRGGEVKIANGSSLQVYGGNIDNRGSLIQVGNGSGLIVLDRIDNLDGLIQVADGSVFSGEGITGGEINGQGQARLMGTFQNTILSGDINRFGGVLIDSSLTGKVQVNFTQFDGENYGGAVLVQGTLTNDGMLSVIGAGDGSQATSWIRLTGNATLAGSGQTVLGPHAGIRSDEGTTGTLTIASGHTLRGSGHIGDPSSSDGGIVQVVNQGTLWVETPAGMTALGGIDNQKGLIKIASGSNFSVAGGIHNQGRIEVESGALLNSSALPILQDSAEAILTVNGSLQVQRLDLAAGVLKGSGSIAGLVNVTGGVIAPGNSPGKLTIEGDLKLARGSVVEIEIAGNEQGVTYDWLSITGSAVLGGDLRLIFLVAPKIGDTFEFLTVGGAVSGAFDSIYAQGYVLDTGWRGHGLSITVSGVAAVPEPSPWALVMAGSLLLVGVWRYRGALLSSRSLG